MKYLYLSLGWLFFALGIIGFFMPVLPSVPFMVLAGFFFSKGSRRVHAWLLGLPYFGAAIREWEEERVLRKDMKLALSASIIFMTAYLLIFLKLHFAVIAVILALSLSALIFIWKYPAKRA